VEIVLSKSRLRPLLFSVMGAVVCAGVAVELAYASSGPRRSGLLPLLSMSYEGNVPTFYTAALLWLVALVCAIRALGARGAREPDAPRWWGLAAGFAYIGVDEVFEIHEMAGALVKGSGVLHFSWVVPAALVVLLVGAAYLPFLRRLPRQTRLRFVIAGAIYVGGAVGMELPLGWWTERHGTHNLGYGLIDAVEEALEMLGLNLFLLALVDHLAEAGVSVRFGHAVEAARESAPPGLSE